MRVGILASEVQGSPTGVGRLLRGWLSCLGDCRPDWRFVPVLQGAPDQDPLWSAPGLEPIFLSRPSMRPTLFEQWILPARLPQLDVFFAPAYSLPRGLRCPSVVAIHDLSFEVLPEEYRLKERWRRRLLARRAARRADRVVTISRRIERELRTLYGVPQDRLGVLPLAVDDTLFRRDAEAPEGVERPYLLVVGSQLERRRPEVVLEAFARLRRDRPELRLVLAGPNRLRRPERLEARIRALGLEDAVDALGFVGDRELIRLMSHAELLFYVSTYEGYGLPPLEALAVGTPAVTSPGLALDELWPEYPYRAADITVSAVTAASERALVDGEERRRVLARGAELVRGLSWRESAERLPREIERVAP